MDKVYIMLYMQYVDITTVLFYLSGCVLLCMFS